ncbi:MAG: sirohydrochlorin cobaltochelatase [Rikenellaceae bacterium]
MKRLMLVAALLLGAVNLNAQRAEYVADKIILNHDDLLAVIMVYNGTSVMDVRRSTFDATSSYMRANLDGRKVVDYHANPVIGLRAKGLEPLLEGLYYDGFTHIIFQPTALSYSESIEKLKESAKSPASSFKEVRFAKPLIYDADDCKSVAQGLKGEVSTSSDAVVLVVDKGYESLSAQDREMMLSALRGEGLNNFSIANGDDAEGVADLLSKSGVKSVALLPFTFVSGVKSAGDVTANMGKVLESKGYKVELINKGLGEYGFIHQMMVDHILFSIDHK